MVLQNCCKIDNSNTCLRLDSAIIIACILLKEICYSIVSETSNKGLTVRYMLCRPFAKTVASLIALSSSRYTLSSTSNTMTKVNLLDLASAAVACTVTASHSICKISAHHGDNGADAKNTRLKADGSFVTDADFKAQGVIVQAIRSVSADVRIVGEESEEEMASHINSEEEFLDDDVLARTREELYLRVNQQKSSQLPLSAASLGTMPKPVTFSMDSEVDVTRVTVIVDPLDGTKSYAVGDYDCVSILIGIVVDNVPVFGVVGKPFSYTGLSPILKTSCVTIYGGSLCSGVFVAGQEEQVKRTPIDASAALIDLPRAVISTSRSKGVVHDFCIHLGEKGLVYPEPMMCSGAGEKSLRLILQRRNEALWFFPKAGTSLWDVAAPDALLRALGGKMSDKFGREMDYSKSREQAENVDGVVACIDSELHEKCIQLFRDGDWDDRSS
jgi:3'-phosphoadenosine 5'-phosphosulfate (PAPS) 3'-phosphatase